MMCDLDKISTGSCRFKGRYLLVVGPGNQQMFRTCGTHINAFVRVLCRAHNFEMLTVFKDDEANANR